MATATQSSTEIPFYPYTPSLVLAIVGGCLYGILVTVHCIRLFITRSWDNAFFISGGICQVAGYAARIYSSQDIYSKPAYGISFVLLILGPTLLMFTVALTQTVFISAIGASAFVWVPIHYQRPLYLAINAALAILQTTGSIILVSATSAQLITSAGKIVISSYIIQIVFWVFLLAENIFFSVKFSRHLKSTASQESLPAAFIHWKYWNQLFGLAIAIIGLGRNLVRLTGLGGVKFLLVNEWPSYAFDGYQMVVVMGAWAIWYLPGKCSREGAGVVKTSENLSEISDTSEKTEKLAGN